MSEEKINLGMEVQHSNPSVKGRCKMAKEFVALRHTSPSLQIKQQSSKQLHRMT